MKDFRNKTAAITGAASGMGRTLALSLAKAGCHVAISDVNEPELEGVKQELGAFGVRVTSKRVNVASREEVYAWADDVVRDHKTCNLIFNNAGVAYGATAEGTTYENFEWIMGINFWGVVYGTKAFLPHLRASGEGHVINTSSLFGLIGFPGQSSYNASKFAVRGFTDALRIELEMSGAPVSVTCVHPGGIKTNIARAARTCESLKNIGVRDPKNSGKFFEKMFRTTAEEAAEVILDGVRKNKARVLVGSDAKALDALQRSLPGGYQRLLANTAKKQLKKV